MSERCPGAIAVRAHELLGWKLIFRRSADIIPAAGHTVLGGFYRITRANEVALNRFEGVRLGRYRRKHFLVGDQWALFYVMNSSYAEEAPSSDYLALIERGYKEWGLPISPLVSALA